ncbi:reverse transcriptase domain-containing protein (plasmid) [Streptomyces sp. NBC_01591]|uniref:reverse transcriptase/maturase family protein n=1 Tax=Streptomyces sp. NBC_01591 TaxID=2975888 RepID=UPI002DD9D953|nr:reverse transcriptase domain-containing protein [Streptomyces sp. NBC_01591]WSD73776.1 reverse transcriptase domain-containing protein [Streptomyces sp. NBC_01591]
MQSAETVLGVLRERGRRGLPCNELYRQLFNPQLYLLAYGRLYSNKGAMTPGVSGETVDGMSLGKIEHVIDALRHERYRWSPARGVYIPKGRGSSKLRPLGLPPWSDKLVGEVIRLLLEAYYEPTFSDSSHGFRPRRGCHTALRDVVNTWTGTVWFIEGDIAQCFDRLDHEVMLRILGEKIRDNRFLRLMRNMLKAGYMEDWVWNATHSGSPQGGVVSPILSNIYLHKMDEYVENVLIPEYTRGRVRKQSRDFHKVWYAIQCARKRDDRTAVRGLRKQLHSMPSGDPYDPGYRRLRYVRYADDTLLGFAGPKEEAEEIRERLAQFLREELKLDMSPEKTLITHARTQAARFLGYDITVLHNDRKISGRRRSVNGTIRLRVPRSVVVAKQTQYMKRGKPARRPELLNQDDHIILSTYGSEYRGIVQYYLLAGDVFRLARLQWVMETSMLMTLANKHRSSVSKMARKYAVTIETPHGLRKCFEARVERTGRKPLVGRFGGIPLRQNKKTVITDRQLAPVNTKRKELVTRLLAGRCESCGRVDEVEVHHVAKLADLGRSGNRPPWADLMAARKRKTLVVCGSCHADIHGRSPVPAHTE